MTSPVLMWLIVAAGFIVVFELVPVHFVFSRNIVSTFLIFPALTYRLYFFLGALKVHRQAPFSVERIGRLVAKGVYSQVRHPIYSAGIVLGWAVFFFYPDTRFLIRAHWLMFVLLFWMKREEDALTQKFGKEYLEYMRRVPKMFPRWIGK